MAVRLRNKTNKKNETVAASETHNVTSAVITVSAPDSAAAIRHPHVSEKGTMLGEHKQYVFRVKGSATKPQVKKAVEQLYGVKVAGVNMLSIPGKTKRLGKSEGFRPGYKKAVVTLKEGKIEFV